MYAISPVLCVSTIVLCVAPLTAQVVRGERAAATASQEGLEDTRWFSEASGEIRRGEYRFTRAVGRSNAWSAPNRAQGFRTNASERGVEVVSRTADERPWTLTLGTRSFGREDSASPLGRAALQVTGARAELAFGELTEWFVNDERGLEQGWTIARPPLGDGHLVIGLAIEGDLSLRIDDGARSGIFVDASGEARARYTGLVAFDATGRDLDARLEPSPAGVVIRVDDTRAVYPLTVDPILSAQFWFFESNQVAAFLGNSVACAGDVNGDGYSDVIVGAMLYDNGQTDEGRVMVFHGSSTGMPLSVDPSWTAELDSAGAWFGYSVATAGDVNGDGYSDVIVGASQYSGGQTSEGRAVVYMGGPTGLAATPGWSVESNQANTYLGFAVSTAGDVNADGYSDVVVCHRGYSNGESFEGRVLLYLGSSAGLATSPAWAAESDQQNAWFGSSLSAAGDVNGDGYDDLLVGASGYGNGQPDEGCAFVYHGSALGLSPVPAWTGEANQGDAAFATGVSAAGDVNGDGYGDVVIGAPGYENTSFGHGRAFVFLGSSSGLASTATWTADGIQFEQAFGYAVATAGDVNADGISDVIVGSPNWDNPQTNIGRAFLYLGSPTGLSETAAHSMTGMAANESFGAALATAGDVNGDGRSDVVVGGYGLSNSQALEGRVYVYTGSNADLSKAPHRIFVGATTDEGLGWSAATAGDVNGDGFSDVIVGAMGALGPGSSQVGAAFVYLGSASGLPASPAWSVYGDQAQSEFGYGVAGAGDVNGDGYSDVIVGAPNYDTPSSVVGRAFVFAGSEQGLSASPSWILDAVQSGSHFGGSVASAGDVNGDGFGDVAVGAPNTYHAFGLVGHVYVYLGSASGLATSPAWSASEPADDDSLFGRAIASGDVNRDGYSDLAIGAPGYSNGQFLEGKAYAYFGSDAGLATTPAWSLEANSSGSHFGKSVTFGDGNGDGFSDLFVGAFSSVSGYRGSSTGLSAGFVDGIVSFNFFEDFAFSIDTADVNNDGYGDLIVGAPLYDGGETDEGRACLFLGSASGIAPDPSWTTESNDSDSVFGWVAVSAGDVNGDGFADALVGAPYFSDALSLRGRVSVYLGNEGRGWTLAAQQMQADESAPIALLGSSIMDTKFAIRIGFKGSLAGLDWASGRPPTARVQWEVMPLNKPLDGTLVQPGSQWPINGTPIEFADTVMFHPPGSPLYLQAATGPHHWRARVRTNNPLFPVTPWVTMAGNHVTETKLSVHSLAPFAPEGH